MDTSSAEQVLSGSMNEPSTSRNEQNDTVISLVPSTHFMDTWTPLPDSSSQQMGNIGKISTHKVHRHNRLHHGAIDYKVPSFAYTNAADQFIEAAQSADKPRLLKMLSSGTDASIADSKGRTALHVAASKGYTDIVTMLLKNKANPNLHDINGNTPLHLAVCGKHAVVMTLLLGAGCKMDGHTGQSACHGGLVRDKMSHRFRRLQAGRLTLQEMAMDQMKIVNLQQVASIKQRRDQERRSTEVMAELSSLSLRAETSSSSSEGQQGALP